MARQPGMEACGSDNAIGLLAVDGRLRIHAGEHRLELANGID